MYRCNVPIAHFCLTISLLLQGSALNASAREGITQPFITIAGKTCKQVDSCEEAVRLWCGGYRRADADSDGIPCENVCYRLDQVEEIRNRIGC